MSHEEKLRQAMIAAATIRANIDMAMEKVGDLGRRSKVIVRMYQDEDRMMAEFAADPDLRAHMRCWMFDFEGTEAPNRKLLESEIDRATHARFGRLPIIVRTWLEGRKYQITDSGSGAGGWHLGVHCDDAELASLSPLARIIFAEQIASGDLTLSLKFWGWHFKGLEEPAEWLKQNALV